MSHDFEPTDAEREMLSYMKDIEVNQKQTELGEIISGAILDGQNQIHDLYREKATSQQIEYRMRRSYVYWMDRLNKANDHQLQKARKEEKERIMRWTSENYSRSTQPLYAHVDLLNLQNFIRQPDHSELDQDKNWYDNN